MAILILLCGLLFLLALLTRDICVIVEVDADIQNTKGGVVVKLFGKKVFRKDFFVSEEERKRREEKKRRKEERRRAFAIKTPHVKVDKKDIKQLDAILHHPIIKRIKFEEIKLKLRFGMRNDLFFTTMAFGSLRTILCGVIGFLKTKLHTTIIPDFAPCFTENCCAVGASIRLRFAILDILLGLLGKLKRRRRIHQQRVLRIKRTKRVKT